MKTKSKCGREKRECGGELESWGEVTQVHLMFRQIEDKRMKSSWRLRDARQTRQGLI